MKRIIKDDVYVTKSTFLNFIKLVNEMGSATLIPVDIANSLIFSENDDHFVMSNVDEEEMEFIKVIGEDNKEFVRNAEFIFDYDTYNKMSLYELEEAHDSIGRKYNSNVSNFRKRIRFLETDEEREKLFEEFQPIMEPLQYEMLELLSLHRQKVNNGEVREEPIDNNEELLTNNIPEDLIVKESKIKNVLNRILKPNKKR